MPPRRPLPVHPLVAAGPPDPNRPLSKEDLREILDLSLRGKAAATIARLVGRRTHGVKCVLWKVKLRYEDDGKRVSLIDRLRGVPSDLDPDREPTLIDKAFAAACSRVAADKRLTPDEVRLLLGLSPAAMAKVTEKTGVPVRRTLVPAGGK